MYRLVRPYLHAALRFARRDLLLLGGAALVVVLLWAFIQLADEVSEGTTHALDVAVLQALREDANRSDPIGPRWFERVVVDFTVLGSASLVTLLVVIAVGYLVLVGKPRLAVLLVLASAGSAVLNELLKSFFGRVRPDAVVAVLTPDGLSFPSGHAMVSAALYPTAGILLARASPHLRVRIYVVGISVGIALLVGSTRVYLGVHYPTDVLGGWWLGFSWALCCGLVARALQRRGVVEPGAERESPAARRS